MRTDLRQARRPASACRRSPAVARHGGRSGRLHGRSDAPAGCARAPVPPRASVRRPARCRAVRPGAADRRTTPGWRRTGRRGPCGSPRPGRAWPACPGRSAPEGAADRARRPPRRSGHCRSLFPPLRRWRGKRARCRAGCSARRRVQRCAPAGRRTGRRRCQEGFQSWIHSLEGAVSAPSPSARCICTVSSQRPCLRPRPRNTPTSSKPKRSCSLIDAALVGSPITATICR